MQRTWIIKAAIGGMIGVVILIGIIAITVTLTGNMVPSAAKNTCFKIEKNTTYAFSNSANTFDKNLFQVILSEKKNQNIILSSHSVSSVLSMILIGAKGKTAQELKDVLALPCGGNITQSKEMYFEAYKSAHGKLQDGNEIELESANRVYLDLNYKISNQFEHESKNYFEPSVITREDFASDTETVRKKINQWVEDKTKNKIKDLLQSGSVSSSTKIVLVNAIYFKGNWLTEFDKSKTQKDTFTLESNETVQADMMTLKAEFSHGYFKDVQARVLKLPYKGSRLAMYLVLPNDKKNIGDTLEAMENVKDLDQDLSEANITISLPKFKIESSYKLKKSLNKLGLETLFDSSQADLTGLNENPKDKSLFVDEVVQKAFIEVNEEGTTAAAATAMMTKSLGTTLNFNKPFLFYIRDTQTGLNLFSGKLMNPNI